MYKVIVISLFFLNLLFGQWKIGEPCADGYVLYPKIGYSITNGSIQQTDVSGEYGFRGDYKFGKQTNFSFLIPLTKEISFIYSTQTANPHPTIYYDDHGDIGQGGDWGRENESKWNKNTIGFSFNLSPRLYKKLSGTEN